MERSIRRAIAELSAPVLLAGSLAVTLAGCDALDKAVQSNMEAQIEEALQTEEPFSGLYKLLAREFPEDYKDFKLELVEVARAGGDEAATADAGKTFMLNFLARNRAHLLAAPDPALLAIRDASIRLIDLFAAQNEALCANFAITGLQPDDEPRGRALAQMGLAARLQIEAIVAGRDNPVTRAAPTESDADAYIRALANHGMSDAQIEDYLNGGPQLMMAGHAEQCQSGLAIYRALADLPDEASARISAVILITEG